MKKRLLFIVLVMGVCMSIISGCGSKKDDLLNYVEISFSGVNGKGTANVDDNLVDLEEKIMSGNEQDVSMLNNLTAFETTISYQLDKNEQLSNGDQVVVSVEWDADKAKACGYKFTGKEKKITVSGLKEAVEIDPFSDVTLEYSGVSPDATLTILNASKNTFVQTIQFSADKSEKIANGDKIKVTAEYNEANAEQEGYVLTSTEKTYEVSGIDEYISAYDKIDKETLEKLDIQSKDIIETKTGDKYGYYGCMYPDNDVSIVDINEDKLNIKNLVLEKAYFFSIKDGMMDSKELSTFSGKDVYNSIFFIYKVSATDNMNPDGVEVFIPLYYSNFIMRDSEKIDVVMTDGCITDSYTNFDNLYKDIVTANKDRYTFEEIKY